MTDRRRGQTTIDFAIGVSLFLLVIAFVFLFVPELFEPFSGGTQEETVAVNRVADELSQRQLGSADEPYVLATTCAVQFFNDTSPSRCNFEPGPINDQLNLTSRQEINVTITRLNGTNVTESTDVLCWDEADDTLESVSKSSCTPGSNGDVRLQRGDSLPVGSTPSVSARRIVTMDGEAVSMTVVMW